MGAKATAAAQEPRRFLVGGEWRRGSEEAVIRNPYDGRPVGSLYLADAADVNDAVEAAVLAFEETRRLSRYRRADILRKASRAVESRRAEIAKLICEEAGKPIRDAEGEVARSVFNLRNAAEEAVRFGGQEVPLDVDEGVVSYQGKVAVVDEQVRRGLGRYAYTRRLPIGPVLGITPFNFPLNLVVHKVAPAVATGNPIVLKPAPQTPLTSLVLAEILLEAGLPPGAVSVVPCSNELAARLVADPRIKMVTFTGSEAVGWAIKANAGKKRVTLELGGNAAVIVEPDAADLEYAARRCVRGAFVYAGQYCIGVQRVLVHRSIYDRFLEEAVRATRRTVVGDPRSPSTEVGPVIDARSCARIESWVQEALAGGARAAVGARRVGETVYAPTVLIDTKREMRVESEEIFGPVMTLRPYDSFDEALAMANDSRFGLQGAVFTRDVSKAFRAFEEFEVGGLMVNDVSIYRIDNMPFGGVKDSGFGREGTRYAMESMTELKLMVLNLD